MAKFFTLELVLKFINSIKPRRKNKSEHGQAYVDGWDDCVKEVERATRSMLKAVELTHEEEVTVGVDLSEKNFEVEPRDLRGGF